MKVNLLKERMTEKQAREAIDRATKLAVRIAQEKGETVPSTERIRNEMSKCAEKDKQKGEI